MQTVQSVRFKEFGSPAEVTEVVTKTLPQPADKQVRIKMKLSPIHNHDVLTIRGDYGDTPELPATGGTEAFGVIDAVGDKVRHLNPGDRVTVVGTQGTWSEYFLAERDHVIPIPSDIPDALAAQLFAMPASAMMALNKLNMNAGDWLIINAANGAVGKTIAQIASARELHTISVVRSENSKQQLIDLGIKNVFSTSNANWKQQIKNTVAGGNITGAIDMVGGSASKDLFNLVSDGATVLSFGAMDENVLQVDVADLIYKGTTLKGFWGKPEFARSSKEEITAIFSELITLAQEKKLRLPVAATFQLKENTDAMNAYFNKRDGKILFSA